MASNVSRKILTGNVYVLASEFSLLSKNLIKGILEKNNSGNWDGNMERWSGGCVSSFKGWCVSLLRCTTSAFQAFYFSPFIPESNDACGVLSVTACPSGCVYLDELASADLRGVFVFGEGHAQLASLHVHGGLKTHSGYITRTRASNSWWSQVRSGRSSTLNFFPPTVSMSHSLSMVNSLETLVLAG